MIGPQHQGVEKPTLPMDDPYREIIHGSRVDKQRLLAEEAAERLASRAHNRINGPRKPPVEFGPLLKIAVLVAFLLVLHQWTKSLDSQSRVRVSAAANKRALKKGSGSFIP
jgi:hypothetical protein